MKVMAEKHKIQGQPSWRLANDAVEAYVTTLGGHLAPVTFTLGKRTIQPFAIAPWATEKVPADTPPILRALRGDFFCLPFGGNTTPYKGEVHGVHGDPANHSWQFVGGSADAGDAMLRLRLNTTTRPGVVDKTIRLRADHRAVYQQHVVSGMTGPMSVGHHATLAFPDAPGSGVISTSPFKLGQVYLTPCEDPTTGGYSTLKPGAEFTSMEQVPMLDGSMTDLSRYPARRGFEDIAILVSDAEREFCWTAVTFAKEKYVWFALKDPKILQSTLLWISNGGRHYAPWNGRHVNTMGLEEITGHFHDGLVVSAKPNSLTKRGFKTAHTLTPKKLLVVNYIMAVAAIPAGFERVADITADGARGVVLHDQAGKTVKVKLDLSHLQAAPL